MIAWTIVGALALAALAYVAAGPRARAAADADAATPELEVRKQAALEAIIDLEEEVESGKLTRGDLAALRTRYEGEALAAQRALDSARAATPRSEDERLEREIAAARARLECPSCGAPRRGARTCPRCGR